MKMTKRIFIALLIVALTVSAFAFSAFAAESTVVDYVNVLEYYEEQSLIDYDFSAAGLDYSESFLANRPANRTNQIIDQVVADASAPGSQYLSVTVKERSGRTAYNDNHVYFGWTSSEAIDDFNIDMTVSGMKNPEGTQEHNAPRIIVVVGENEFTDMSAAKTNGVTVAAIDYRGGYFTYLKEGGEYKTDYKIEEGAWYNVSLTYDVDNGMSITVYNCADPANAITVTDGYIPYTSVKDIRVGAHGDDSGTARGSIMQFADIRLLGGVYHREIADMQSDIEAKLLEMHALFLDDNALVEDKIAVCEVVEKLVAYGFTTEKADVQAALDELGIGVFGLYNTKIEQFVGTVNTLETFAEKKALAEETLTYADALKELDFNTTSAEMAERSEKNLNEFNRVSEELKKAEADSVKFLATVEDVKTDSLTDYAVVTANLALFDGCEPDLTYEGVEDAYRYYTRIVNAENDIRTSAEAFITAVGVANNTELDFNTRAEAFDSIENGYYCDNETYPGVTEALAIYYDVLVVYMNQEISNAENFIMYVNKADYALYISAKQENLDIAKTYMDICQPGFEGVAEAKVLYAEVQKYIDEQLANVKAYVDAVNALDSLSGTALTNGIKNAQSLQKSGNVLGVDGVTEANIKLNQIIASIELKERYCIHFINLVAKLDTASDATATYIILAEARDAESYVDKSYAGVADASAKLAKAISDFNAQVEAINSEFEKANNVAANTCGVGGATNTVYGHVIALVKKFFDED